MGKRIVRKTFKLSGLSCSACEIRIENQLLKTEGVIDVRASYASSTVEIKYNADIISPEDIKTEVEKAGYSWVGDITELPKERKDPKDRIEPQNQKYTKDPQQKTGVVANGTSEKGRYTELAVIAILILGIYLIIKNTIGFNFIPEVNSGMGYGVLFFIGLLTSLHCVAMCGGINLSVCMSYNTGKKDEGRFSKFIPALMYNAGRVISYTIIGGAAGALGSVFSMSNAGSAAVSILAGAFMVIMGLNMLNIFPWLRKLNPHMPKAFAKKVNSKKKNKGPFVVGILNGLMPCGPLQAMQLYALGTGSFLAGALSMFLFSIGTVPLLFVFGALGSFLSSRFTKNMLKVSAVLVIVMGFLMFNRGFAFTGLTFSTLNEKVINTGTGTTGVNSAGNAGNATGNAGNSSAATGEVQEIKTNLKSSEYDAITVKAGVPVKWIITAEAKNLNGCNNQIVIPKYGIRQKLVAGENIITFTPADTGTFGYSCWMGMIRSTITVTER